MSKKPEEKPLNSQAIIKALSLEAHVEGGYFKRSYSASDANQVQTPYGMRLSMSSIYYLLTTDSPKGHWHLNRSDIQHYYQLGAAIEYFLLHPNGELEVKRLGPNILAGEQLQLTVKGGTWKASRLLFKDEAKPQSDEFGLVAEAVSPGFDYADMQLGQAESLIRAFPMHEAIIRSLSKS